MEHTYPLSRLSIDITTVRTKSQTLRLVLRNTERFGLIHLYFERGHLVQVQGHKEGPLKSFADLSTWTQGTIRQDEVALGAEKRGVNPGLEEGLDSTLLQLESRGVVQAPPTSRPSRSYQAETPPYVLPMPVQPPSLVGGNDLPPSW